MVGAVGCGEVAIAYEVAPYVRWGTDKIVVSVGQYDHNLDTKVINLVIKKLIGDF